MGILRNLVHARDKKFQQWASHVMYTWRLILVMSLVVDVSKRMWFGYRSTLLSTLITIRYEKPIETVQQLADSGLTYMVPANTAPHLGRYSVLS